MRLSPADLGVTGAHARFFSHRFFRSLLSSRPGRGAAWDGEVAPAFEGLGIEALPKDAVDLARRWAAELDRHGVWRARAEGSSRTSSGETSAGS